METSGSGSIVWRNLDQQALDRAYDQGVFAPNRDQVLRRWTMNSEQTRAVLGLPGRVAYGPSETEHLDVYRTAPDNAPVQVFVHGGGWRSTTAADYALLAEPFVRAGAHLVVPDFAPVGDHDGDLRPMVEQVRRAVVWVYQNARTFGGDPERIFLSGHSSGAHLGGCVVTTDWPSRGLPADVVKGALLISGMYDLEPVRLSARSSYVTITDEIEAELSPIRHLDRLTAPLILSYGSFESPEFKRHSEELCAAAQAAGKDVRLILAHEYNHFEILETLATPYGLLGRAALAQMGLAPA